jgi:hypothetical protein
LHPFQADSDLPYGPGQYMNKPPTLVHAFYWEVFIFGACHREKTSRRLLYDLKPTHDIRSHGILSPGQSSARRSLNPIILKDWRRSEKFEAQYRSGSIRALSIRSVGGVLNNTVTFNNYILRALTPGLSPSSKTKKTIPGSSPAITTSTGDSSASRRISLNGEADHCSPQGFTTRHPSYA